MGELKLESKIISEHNSLIQGTKDEMVAENTNKKRKNRNLKKIQI